MPTRNSDRSSVCRRPSAGTAMMWACWASDTSLTFPVRGRHQPSGNLQAHVLLYVPKPAQRHDDRGWERRPAGLLLLRLRSDQPSSRGAVVARGRGTFSLCDDVALAVRAARLPFVSLISFAHEFGNGGSSIILHISPNLFRTTARNGWAMNCTVRPGATMSRRGEERFAHTFAEFVTHAVATVPLRRAFWASGIVRRRNGSQEDEFSAFHERIGHRSLDNGVYCRICFTFWTLRV